MFSLGLFLIPFENFFFAPSAGWGAIAPVVFFFYVIYNLKHIGQCLAETQKILLIYGSFVILSLINYMFFGFIIGNIVDNVMTLTLGLFFYFALYIRYIIQKNNFFADLKILYFSYAISLGVGVFQYIVYKLNISFIISIIGKLSKRFYYPRVQFTFTEPSFIPIHLFGFLLIIFMFFNKNKIKISKNSKILFCAYVIIGNVISSSGRLVLDTAIILSIVALSYFLNGKTVAKKIVIIFIGITILFGFITNKEYINKNIVEPMNPRIARIIDKGVYYDASLASRYFRVNASIKGYKKNVESLFFGNGMGNIYINLKDGYNEAREEYKNDYMSEVNQLRDSTTKTLFSMPIKLISEYGLILTLIIICSLFSKKYLDIYLVMMYLYLQFDSYALYTVWLYIFLRKHIIEMKKNAKMQQGRKKDDEKNSIDNRDNRTRRIIPSRVPS